MIRPRIGTPDRRGEPRGSPTEPSREQLLAMIVGAYREMPGLSLSLPQAARLFGISVGTCQLVLDQLVASGELRQTPDGQYRLL